MVRADDSAFLDGVGCYTSARVRSGRPRWPDRHAARLVRDARALGLGGVDPTAARRALDEIARAAFGDGDGAVRLQASRDGAGRLHLVAVPRRLGDDPPAWRAVDAPTPHPGPSPWPGAKLCGEPWIAAARAAARAAGADEALLWERRGLLVEGGRSGLVLVPGTGPPRFPEPSLGGVASLALEVAREAIPELAPGRLDRAALRGARELVALNAVRGARAVVAVDGVAVGDGHPGPFAGRLAAVLDAAPD